MKDKRRKQDVRRIAAQAGISYTSALRMLEGQDRLKVSVDDMLVKLRAFLEERPRNRLWLVHGFERDGVASLDIDDPDLDRDEVGVELTLTQPIVWEVEPHSFPVRASDEPTTEEVDNLHVLLSNYIGGGELGNARLARWEYTRDPSNVPSAGGSTDAKWMVTAMIAAR